MRPIEFEILLTLASGERHGYAIIQDIEARSRGAQSIETGTLYRALQRLVEADHVRPSGARAPGDGDERRRVYVITLEGRRAAAAEARRMDALVNLAREARLFGSA